MRAMNRLLWMKEADEDVDEVADAGDDDERGEVSGATRGDMKPDRLSQPFQRLRSSGSLCSRAGK